MWGEDEVRNEWDEACDAQECAEHFAQRYNMRFESLLYEPEALVEAGIRWFIRGDGDPEAHMWLSELIGWQRVSASKIATVAAQIIDREYEPMVAAMRAGL